MNEIQDSYNSATNLRLVFNNGLISRGINKKIIGIETLICTIFLSTSVNRSMILLCGGAGMVLRVDVVANALKKLKVEKDQDNSTDTAGKEIAQKDAVRLSKEKELFLIAGRFEGYDERIRALVDEKFRSAILF